MISSAARRFLRGRVKRSRDWRSNEGLTILPCHLGEIYEYTRKTTNIQSNQIGSFSDYVHTVCEGVNMNQSHWEMQVWLLLFEWISERNALLPACAGNKLSYGWIVPLCTCASFSSAPVWPVGLLIYYYYSNRQALCPQSFSFPGSFVHWSPRWDKRRPDKFIAAVKWEFTHGHSKQIVWRKTTNKVKATSQHSLTDNSCMTWRCNWDICGSDRVYWLTLSWKLPHVSHRTNRRCLGRVFFPILTAKSGQTD